MDEKTGNVAPPVDPESFFTDETPESTAQQPQPTTENNNAAPQAGEVWDGKKWSFKAAGKIVEPKSRDELMRLASLGVNYDEKARKLNQQKAELLALKKELESAKEAKADLGSNQEESDISSLFSDPTAELNKKIAAMEERLKIADSYVQKQEISAMDAALSEGMAALTKEAGLTDEETDELLLELQERIDTIPDSAIDTPDNIKRVLRNLYFELHPDAIDEIAERRANEKADKLKKSISGKIVTEGSDASAPTGKPHPTDFLDAQNKLLDAWDSLPNK
jgi:hypothetical protein